MTAARSRPFRMLAVAGAATLALSACTDAESPESDPPPSSESASSGTPSGTASSGAPSSGATAADPAPAVEVKLLKPGAAPREAYRLELEEGHVERTTTEVATTFDIGIRSMVPSTVTIRVPHTTTVTAVDGDETTVEVEYGEPEVVGELEPAIRDQAEKGLAYLEGATARVVHRSDGTVVSSKLDLGDDAPDLVRRLLEDLTSHVGSTAVPFPQEEIGEGARWRVRSELAIGGGTVDQVATYTLREVDGDDYTISLKVKQKHQPGPTAAGRIVNGRGRATGTVEGRRGLLAPVSATSKARGRSTVEVGGQRVRSRYRVQLSLTTR